MGLSVRQFVENLSTYGIVPSAELTTIREATPAGQQELDCESLLRDLVKQGKLTKFQATNLYQGRGRGLVFGEYVILDKIGAGGMGQVYKAQHKRMKRIVALKVLPPQIVKSSKAVERFHQEVEVAAKLTHPNIVTAYDAGEAHGMHYLVMEFVDGKDLSSHVNKNGPLTLEQTLNVALQAAKGLAYAHGLNIIHRDIKPSNLLVDRKGVVKILDMGLARVSNPIEDGGQGKELTADGEVMGTMDYMAPEQAMDTRTADHRADIYALGCTIYRLYVGKAPYEGETAVQKILAHRDKPIPSLRAARPETLDMVDRLYQKMMAKNPADRTQTMAAVVQSLERFLSGVDDDRSSVMLGSEPIEADGHFLPGSSLGGGSALNLSSSPGSLPSGSSGINFATSPTPTVAAQAAHPHLPGVSRAASTVGGAGAAASRDTDAIVRSIMQAKPAPAKDPSSVTTLKKSNRTMLLVGGAAVLVAAGIVAFLLTRKSEPPAAAPEVVQAAKPGEALAATASATRPAPLAVASASSTAPEVQPAATPTATASATAAPTNFFGLPAPPPDDPPRPPAPSGTKPPPATRPTDDPPAVARPTELTGEVDLLALVDLKTGHQSRWKREGNAVVCDETSGPGTRVLVPFLPPAEYDLTCVAVPTVDNAMFGVGLIVEGRQVMFVANDDKCGLGDIDGRRWSDGANPTFRHNPKFYFRMNDVVTMVCSVRRGRTYITLNDKPIVDFTGVPARLTPTPELEIPPDTMYLYGTNGSRFTRLTIEPPLRSLPSQTVNVNLAAGFESTNVVEGIGTATRGGFLFNAEPSKYGKLAFSNLLLKGYAVTAVVERTYGGDVFALGLPIGPSRVSALVDFRGDRLLGFHLVGVSWVDNNPTGRRYGHQLVPGEYHVVRASIAPDPKGWRIRMSINDREVVDHVGHDFREDGGLGVPDPRALCLTTLGSGWRILRLDIASTDGRRASVPDTEARLQAAQAVISLTSQAAAKGAALDVKLSAVDLLRKKAVTELHDPAVRYAALEEALRIAATAGDLSGAYEAAEDLIAAFDVEPRDVHARVIDAFKAPRSTQAEAKRQFADEAFKLMDRAAKCQQWDYALDLNAELSKLLVSSGADVKRELKARASEYASAKSLAEPAVAARQKLTDGANDAAAQTDLGKYLCFALGDWPNGLRALAQSDHSGLKEVAALELGELSSGEAKFALAEKWWALSEKEKTTGLKWAEAERAALWYRRSVATTLSDKTKKLLTNRLPQLAQLRRTSGGAGGPRRPLDAEKNGDRWYKTYAFPMHWDVAVQTCEQLGGNVVVIDTPAENQFVAEQVLKSLAGQQSIERASIWLGFSDTEQEGTYRRLDGTPIPPVNPTNPITPPFANWAGGEPNNGNGDEDYGMMDISLQAGQVSTSWRDANKSVWNYTVCEWDH